MARRNTLAEAVETTPNATNETAAKGPTPTENARALVAVLSGVTDAEPPTTTALEAAVAALGDPRARRRPFDEAVNAIREEIHRQQDDNAKRLGEAEDAQNRAFVACQEELELKRVLKAEIEDRTKAEAHAIREAEKVARLRGKEPAAS